MKRKRTAWVAATCLASALLLSKWASAQSPNDAIPAEAWEGAEVSIQAADATVKTILMEVAKQAGLGLAVTAPAAEMNKPLTLMVKKRPAQEVIEIIRASNPNLKLEFKNGMLLVTEAAPVKAALKEVQPVAAPPTEPAPSTAAHEDLPHNWREKWKAWSDGHKKKERVEFGKSLTVTADEQYESAVAIGGDNTVYGRINKDAVSIGGNLIIKSGAVVLGTAVSVGGSVIIEPGARVEDDAVSVGGELQVSEEAVLGGSRVSIGIPMPSMAGAAGAMGGMIVLYIIGAIIRTVMLLALALLLLWIMPRRLEAVGGYISARPGLSTLSGLLVFVGMIPVIVVLAISIIGIPLIPIAILILIAMVVVGHTAVMGMVGQKVPLVRANQLSIKAMIVGFVVFLILNLIPILGGLLFFFVTMVGVGAAFQTRFGGRPAL